MGIHASDPHGVLDVIPRVTKLITIHATTEMSFKCQKDFIVEIKFGLLLYN